MSRDFAGLMCNINDYVMHMHNSLDSPGYIAPEFRTEKVRFPVFLKCCDMVSR